MNKQDAADYLGISLRTLEKYMAQNKIAHSYGQSPVGGRPPVRFNQEDLDAFRNDSAFPAHAKKPVARSAESTENIAERAETSLAKYETPAAVVRAENLAESADSLTIHTEDLATLIQRMSENSSVRIAEKILLTVSEVQALTGLSQRTIRDAIKAKELRAAQIGRAYRTSRVDVEAWASKKLNG